MCCVQAVWVGCVEVFVLAIGIAFKGMFLMVGKPVWWRFLRINDDGWSSEFQSVDLLLKHLGRKSRSVASRNQYCYVLWKICSSREVRKEMGDGIGPEELILRARQDADAVAGAIQDFADNYNDMGSIRSANNVIHLVKTFFRVNKVDLDLHGYFQPARSRKRSEHIPSLQEALRMADVAGSLRDRLIILFLIYTGLRNSTLRALVYNESYPDPLLQEHTIKKELERGQECLIIIVHEVMKQRISNACKNRVFYYTFIPPKVTECLRLHLREVEDKYGPISDDQPIFNTEDRRIPLRERLKTHISNRQLQGIVKELAKRAGIKNWKYVYPQCLRKTYESFLRNQPDDVRLDVKEREFFFGHTLPGSQDTYFDKTKIDQMRKKYAKMIFEPIKGVETEERVIGEDELQKFLQQRWHFVANLPSGKVVVSRKVVRKQPTEVKTATKPQFSLDAGVEKESPGDHSKSLEQNQLSSLNCPNSPNQSVPRSTNHEKSQVPKKSGQSNLQRWTSSLEAELYPNSESKPESISSFPSKFVAEEKKNASEAVSQNRPNNRKQSSLFDFLI